MSKQPTEPRRGIPPKFIVDDNGHLVRGKKKKKIKKGAFKQPKTCGGYGFAFTPMGYNDYSVKANVSLKGVRKELGATSPAAHQYLHKKHNVQREQDSFMVGKDKKLDTMRLHGHD